MNFPFEQLQGDNWLAAANVPTIGFDAVKNKAIPKKNDPLTFARVGASDEYICTLAEGYGTNSPLDIKFKVSGPNTMESEPFEIAGEQVRETLIFSTVAQQPNKNWMMHLMTWPDGAVTAWICRRDG